MKVLITEPTGFSRRAISLMEETGFQADAHDSMRVAEGILADDIVRRFGTGPGS